MVIQDSYSRHQRAGFYGDVARPVPPCIFDVGQVAVAVKPGAGVLYDATDDKWRLPTTMEERLDVSGIVGFDSAVKGNSDGVIEFVADSTIKVGVMGHFYAKAGEALTYGDLVVYDEVDGDWIKYTRTIEDFSATQPADMTGTVDLAGVSTYVQGAIGGLDADVSAYVRSAILTLPRAPVIATTKAAIGGLIELRFSGALVR